MTTLSLEERELVIEIEKVQRIRRTAETYSAVCRDCGSKSEFVDLGKLSALFEVAPSRFLEAMRANACHISRADRSVRICVTSLLTLLQRTVAEVSPSGSFLKFTAR